MWIYLHVGWKLFTELPHPSSLIPHPSLKNH